MTRLLRRAAALMSLLLLGALSLVGALDWANFQRDLQQRQALLVRVMADEVARTLNLAVLSGAQTGQRLLEAGQGTPDRNTQLRTALAYQSEVRALTLVDRDGRALASTDAADQGTVVPVQSWRQQAKVSHQAAWLGPLLRARRLADLDGGAVPLGVELLPMVQEVGPPDLGWSLITQFNPDRFATHQLQVLNGQPSAAAALLRVDGALLASGSTLGAHAAWPSLRPLTEFLPARESAEWTGQGLRDGTQLAAFRLVRGWPLLCVVETRQSDALGAWWIQSRNLLLSTALAGLSLIAALLVAARVQAARERALAQRDLARATAEQREEQLKVVVESLNEAVFRTDAEGRIAYISPQIETLLDAPPAQWVGKPLTQLAAPPQRARVAALITAPGGTGTAERLLLSRQEAGEDRQRWFDLSVRALLRDGVVTGFAGSLGEATDRVLAQRSLEAQLNFLEQELEVSPLPTSVTDLQRHYVFVNHAWEEFMGRERADVLGKRVGLNLDESARGLHESMDQELIASGRPLRYAAQIRHADGRLRDVIVLKMLLLGNGAQSTRIVAKILDVTELRDAERATREARDAAEQASRVKSEFIANVSHELRTPLQSIIGFSELGEARSQQQPRLQTMFGDIHAAGQRMLRLVNDLLDASRLDSDTDAVRLREAEFRALLEPIAHELEPLLMARQLNLRLHMPQAALPLQADPSRLQQVLRNLLANAIKFSPAGTTLQVSAETSAAGLRVMVDDEGPGIPQGELETIFEAFTQSSRTKDGSGGSGLGLTISRKIVEAHGGKLWAENRPNGGARFVMELP